MRAAAQRDRPAAAALLLLQQQCQPPGDQPGQRPQRPVCRQPAIGIQSTLLTLKLLNLSLLCQVPLMCFDINLTCNVHRV